MLRDLQGATTTNNNNETKQGEAVQGRAVRTPQRLEGRSRCAEKLPPPGPAPCHWMESSQRCDTTSRTSACANPTHNRRLDHRLFLLLRFRS